MLPYHVSPEVKDNNLQDQFTFQKMSKTAAVTKPRCYKLIFRDGKCGRTSLNFTIWQQQNVAEFQENVPKC